MLVGKSALLVYASCETICFHLLIKNGTFCAE